MASRSKGSHGVVPMAEIVRALLDEHGLPVAKVERFLGMEREEAEGLYNRACGAGRGEAVT